MTTKSDLTPRPATTRDADLRRYCTMGAGTAVLLGAVTTMDASVVYTNYNSEILTDTNTADTTPTSYVFDVNGDGINDLIFFVRNEGSASAGNASVITAGATGSTVTPLNVVGQSAVASATYRYPSRLTLGATVGASKAFVTLGGTVGALQNGSLAFGNGYPGSKWTTDATKSGFLGFSFTYGGGLHYGFIGMTVGPQGNGSLSRAISIGGIGYETTADTAITTFGSVGAIPEPSSLALLAAGGLGGVAAYRRRRKSPAPTK